MLFVKFTVRKVNFVHVKVLESKTLALLLPYYLQNVVFPELFRALYSKKYKESREEYVGSTF